MLERLRTWFAPRVNPAEELYRRRLTRAIIVAAIPIMAVWLVLEMVALRILRNTHLHAYQYDFAAILVLSLALGAAYLLQQRGHSAAGGLVVSAVIFLYPAVNALFAPHDAYLVNPILVVSVLAAGAILGVAPAYVFASASVIINIVTWLHAGTHPIPDGFPHDATTGVIFVFVQAVIAFSAAAVMHSLWRQFRHSLDMVYQQAEQMTDLAHTDPLTGLANRRWLMAQFEREFSRARRYFRPLALLYLDLDGFKGINDRFGHLFGDEVLQGASRAMLAVLRTTDTLARVGGDEFAVLLPETSLEGALNVANKLRRALAAYSHQLGPAVPGLTFCAGLSQLHNDDRSIDDILSRADDAQYLAKTTGKAHTRTEGELSEQAGALRPGAGVGSP
jgi:diguanylate cyclase (GGDEF)-like protein